MFEIEHTDEFEKWWNTLSTKEQEDVAHSVGILEQFGPSLGRPYVDTLSESQFKNMKELRTQSGGKPLILQRHFDNLLF